jgi:DNA uptake protein ComE-like DNA-binding protein
VSHNNWFDKNPQWLWWSFFPIFGGISLIYAGWKAKTNIWLYIGSSLTLASIILSSSVPALVNLVWISQVVIAFKIKESYLIKTAPKGVLIPSSRIAVLMAENYGQVDINNCSKDDIVYRLGLSIIYANDIDSLRYEGYNFTNIDELSDVVGIPENVLRRIEPLIVFGYDLRKELDVSWRRLNTLSVAELMSCNLEEKSALKIVIERQKHGEYQSLLDVKKRTGIPINVYRHLV